MRYGIATPHGAATEAGVAAFEAGGTAVDAALTAAAVLTVVYPHMCAIGGDLVALVAAPGGDVSCVNATGAAAAALDPAGLAARHGGVMPATGPDTITVPGMVGGWAALARLGARSDWPRLLAPAIELAERGVEPAPHLVAAIDGQRGELARDPGMRAVMLGPPPLRQPALAASLAAIAAGGPEELYGGALGEALIGGLRPLGCALTTADLAAHETELVAPIGARFRHDEVLTSPPNTQGFVLLSMLDGMTADNVGMRFETAAAMRDAVLGDPRRGSGDTVAIVAADEDGHAISIIQSVFGSFGSLILEPATGIVCHNRGAAFTLRTGHPNRLAPRKRPAHTLMPVLVRRDGRIVGAHGTMGALLQPLIHAELLLRLDEGLDAAAAVAAPRSHDAGHAQLVRRSGDGAFTAGSDPRADGTAVCGERRAG